MNTKDRHERTVSVIVVLTLACLLFGLLSSVWVDQAVAAEYNPQDAGHPLRIVAYLVSPLGTLADYCLLRPGYWIVRHEPFATVFGYHYMTSGDEEEKPDVEKK